MAYDVAVLGGGPGGYEAAIRCAKYGLQTVLIEDKALGGTCLNRGCIPTKALLHSAELYASLRGASALGVRAEDTGYDYAAMAKRKDRIVQRLTGGVGFLEKAYGVTVLSGFGVLTGPHTLEVDGTVVEAENIILATGSYAAVPPIPGAGGARVLTSDGVLALTEAPESIVIVGGGVIGLEFAALFTALGKKTTVIEMIPELLPELDREVVDPMLTRLKRGGAEIHTGAKITEIVDGGADVTVRYETGDGAVEASAEYCAVCAGRKPATEGIGLDAAGVARDARGYILVDEHMRTNVPGIYAIGDITGKIQLAHVASHQGMVAAAGCAGLERSMDYGAIPACVYSIPEIAYVGKQRKALEAEGIAFKVGEFRAVGNGRAMTLGETDGIVRLYAAAEDGRVLGAQIFAPSASDMIAEIAAVMHFGGTVRDIAETVHPHPSLSEMLMEAALDADGLSCNSAPK